MTRTKTTKQHEPTVTSLDCQGRTWVDIVHPTTRETEYLAERYPFHQLDLDDCLSRIQRPKIDEYKDYLFLVLHFPVFDKRTRVTTPSQVSVFIADDYLITLHNGDLKPLVKLFKECQQNEKILEQVLGAGTGTLLYGIVDRLVDYCLPILSKIGANIERVEEEIFSRTLPRSIREISMLRRDVIAFRRIIWPLRAVAGSLKGRVGRFTTSDIGPYFDDLVDHVDRIWDGLDEYKEIIEGLSDTHDSLATNRTNEIVRMLTVIATVMLPITVVASVFGMNIPLGFFQNSGLSALFVLVICVIIITAMLLFFRRQRWI